MCPEFFIHKWETRKGQLQLLIEVPHNIEKILANEPDDETEQLNDEVAYPLPLNDSQLFKRREMFSEELCAICYDYFKQ